MIVRSHIIHELRNRIQGIEGTSRGEDPAFSTGCEALDGLLAERGLKRGALVEWLSKNEGCGASTLALSVAAHLIREEGTLVVIDEAGEFYPPTAAALGIPLERTVMVRPERRMSALWAWEQALRCPGVTVTLGWINAVSDRLFRRLQLAVEAGVGWGFLLRPPEDRSAPSWAGTRIVVSGQRSAKENLGRRMKIQVTRGQREARPAFVEMGWDHETSHVRLLPQLADSTAACRPAG